MSLQPRFGMYDIQIAQENLFPPPGKRPVPISCAELAVRKWFHVVFPQHRKAVLPEFRYRSNGNIPVMRTDTLAFIAAEDERRTGYDSFFRIGKLFFLLGKIGFAETIVIRPVCQTAAGTYTPAGPTMETFPVHRCIRSQRQCRQDGADKAIGAIHGMDETLIVSHKSKAGFHSQQSFRQR